MFSKLINPREIISAVKPEFAQFQKRVKYVPVDATKIPFIPEKMEHMAKYELINAYKAALNSDVDAQMLAVQGAIECYAKQKNVFIDLVRDVHIDGRENPKLMDKIAIDVYNPKTKEKVKSSISVFEPNSTVNMVKKSKVMLHNSAEGTEVVRLVRSESEDNFVRYLYRTIENLVKRSNIK